MTPLASQLQQWSQQLEDFRLPRWDELPDLDLYMDQVIKLIEQYLTPVIQTDKHALLTPAMVNNYVKHDLIPPPKKKRYTKKHVAFLIAITLLKQVLTIPEIKQGILAQSQAIGIREAYNVFCQLQEEAIHEISSIALGNTQPRLGATEKLELLAAKAATTALANKLLAEQTITLQTEYGIQKGAENE
ncbi:MAG: DUF1836 domain-containing protein [Enterococcus sp.]